MACVAPHGGIVPVETQKVLYVASLIEKKTT